MTVTNKEIIHKAFNTLEAILPSDNALFSVSVKKGVCVISVPIGTEIPESVRENWTLTEKGKWIQLSS